MKAKKLGIIGKKLGMTQLYVEDKMVSKSEITFAVIDNK